VSLCIEEMRRCIIEAHKKLARDLLRCRGNAFCNVAAIGRYFLALCRCREALLACDAAAKRATNCQ